MNKLKIIATSMIAFAFVLISVSPSSAAAKGVALGLTGNTSVSTNLLNVNASANANASVSKDKDHDDDKDKEEKKDERGNDDKILPKGIEKRLEDGKDIPPGIFKNWFNRFFHHATTTGSTTVDMVRPVVKGVNVTSVSSTSAMITWKTNESTSGEVHYSVGSSVGATSSIAVDTNASTSHSVVLSGLSADTNYFFTITAKDSAGNIKTTNVLRFHTRAAAAVDIAPPRVWFNVVFSTTASSTHIFWLTNERSDSRVWLSTSSSVNTSGSSTVSLSDKVLAHNVTVSGLNASTTYYYAVESKDEAGNISAATTGSFTTSAQ